MKITVELTEDELEIVYYYTTDDQHTIEQWLAEQLEAEAQDLLYEYKDR